MWISLIDNKSENIRMNKDITVIDAVEGECLRDESSLIDPVFLIQTTEAKITKSNYLYIGTFKRYYFITNVEAVRYSVYRVSAHVDVLMSYQEEIKENYGITQRQETDWNLYLNDGSLKTYQDPITQVLYFQDDNGHQADAFNDTMSFILLTAGRS